MKDIETRSAPQEAAQTQWTTHQQPRALRWTLDAWRARWVLAALLAGSAGWCAAAPGGTPAAAAPSQAPAVPQADGVLTADGALVLDERARLVWSRCVEGMQWDGRRCTGQAQLLDRAGAEALAQQRWKDEGLDWRLPRVMELQRLVDKGQNPSGLPRALFPAAPAEWHWSATRNVDSARANPYNYGNVMRSGAGDGDGRQLGQLKGWAVHLGTGEARGDVARTSKLPVRLVRSYLDKDRAAHKAQPAADKP